MSAAHEPNPGATESRALELAAQVAAKRISQRIGNANGSRVMYAIVDLDAALTCAIGKAVAALSRDDARIEVAIHPELAVDGLDKDLRTSEVATRFRNRKDDGVVATIFSVPGRQMEGVLQSLGTVDRVNEAWLCEPEKAALWANEMLPNYSEEIREPLKRILRGLMESGILTSAPMLANFCAKVESGIRGAEGLDLGSAVNQALPWLRLPRDCAPEMKGRTIAADAYARFRHWREEFQPHLYLASKDGQLRPRQELLTRLEQLRRSGDLKEEAAQALENLVKDVSVTAGVWVESQQQVANRPWREVRPFFRGRSRKQTVTLGEETIRWLDDEFPDELSQRDREILEEVRRETQDASPDAEAVFVRHRERLSDHPKLYKRWERFVFNKPVEEDDDLLRGLIRLAERACQKVDDVSDPVMIVRLRGNAEKKSFWTSDKSGLCNYLRDRYRGLDKALRPWAELDFGRCWKGDWTTTANERAERGGARAEFEFEAFVVDRAAFAANAGDEGLWREGNKAQMVWKPGNETFATAFTEDLGRIAPKERQRAFLLRAKVDAARSARGSASERATVEKVTSITDSLGRSQGSLANPAEDELDGMWNRIDELWHREIKRHTGVELNSEEARVLNSAFERFHEQYTKAIRAILDDAGEGLASDALIEQAKSYGDLLGQLRRVGRAEVLVRDLWEPLLQIGTATVRGDADAMIVAPWHPLRLAEIGAKTEQAARMIERIVTSPSDKTREVEQYVKDRIQSLRQTYYANVGLIRSSSGRHLLMETETRATYSLLERPFAEDRAKLTDEPIDHAVDKLAEIAEHYLKLRPHERANFSAVLLDAEADELPKRVAKHLADKIESEADLRCDLYVTHEDPRKLRQIYERQNRHIGHEIESSLTSEAGRIFLSRLRVGITPPELLESPNGTKRQDIVLLHDVIARRAEVAWHEATPARSANDLLIHVPTDISRRKSQSSGGLSTSVYLTSPSQVTPSQAYLDAMHDVLKGEASNADKHFLPAQKVELGSTSVAKKLEQAHGMANWVITYDRIADRRLIARSNEQLRILRYFSAPRSRHNVIVSTEISRDHLRDRLREDLDRILPGSDSESLERLVQTIHQRSTSLSGSIVTRGAHWDNYAQELIGLIVAQREIELLLAQGGEHRTAMFFLDEFRDWLDISGEIADILAVDLRASADGEPQVRLMVVEAKCVGEGGMHESLKRSWTQLEMTYGAIESRFTTTGTTIDPAIWRHRLADMLVEHMDPWGDRQTIADKTFGEWLDAIRRGEVPFDVSGHSIVAIRDMEYSGDELEPRIDELKPPRTTRRRLAQWRLGADRIAKTIRGIADDSQRSQLYEPDEWGQAEPGPEGGTPASDTPKGPHSGTSTPRKDEGHEGREDEVRGRNGAPSGSARSSAESSRNLSPDRASRETRPSGAPNGTLGTAEVTCGSDALETPHASAGASRELNELDSDKTDACPRDTPSGWKSGIHEAVLAMQRPNEQHEGEKWLQEVVERFKQALQAQDMQAPIENAVLTPNSALLRVGGGKLGVKWLESRRTDLMTAYRVEIIRITPMPGCIAVALKRPRRGILHVCDVWVRRKLEPSAPTKNLALVIGEQEDDGTLFYLSLESDFEGQEQAAPHTLVSGTTGSGKGILVSNLILDVCAFNDPRSVEIYLIDPKRGADYLWARDLPHLREGIVEEKNDAIALLRQLVEEMEQRYRQITEAGCANIAHYNRDRAAEAQLPRVIIFFDEVANWMQDDDFKKEVESIINEIATKSRAAGLHLFMIYQRADKDVMSMQLRTNLGNKLILRLGDEGSSRIELGEKGAETLQGKGHIIAKLGTNEKIYGQVPFIKQDEARTIASAIASAWPRKKW